MFQYSVGMMPHRKPINVVVGSPVKVDKVENPTPEEVDRTHARYVEALVKLYDEYNPIYGDPTIKLTIV